MRKGPLRVPPQKRVPRTSLSQKDTAADVACLFIRVSQFEYHNPEMHHEIPRLLDSEHRAVPLRFASLIRPGRPDVRPAYRAYAAMSRNGQHVLTVQSNGNVLQWTPATGQTSLGLNVGANGYVSAITDDGTIVAGYHKNASNVTTAFRWTAATGFTDLGDLPGGSTYSLAYAMSANGNVIVGYSSSANSGTGKEGFRWTPATGIQPLGDLLGGKCDSDATAISADGSVIVGTSNQTAGYEAYRYTDATGMLGLGNVPGGYFNSQAYDISSNGNVIVGYSSDSLNREQAFRWTASDGLVPLGFASTDPDEWSQAHAVSNDGNLIVGNNNTGTTLADIRAIAWDPTHGMRYLQDALFADYGLALPAGRNLAHAWDVSDDGHTIGGSSYSTSGVDSAWIVTGLPEPTNLPLLALGAMLISRRLRSSPTRLRAA